MESSKKRVKNRFELYKLKQGRRVWNEDNIEPDIGKPYVIYSPYSDTFYDSFVREYTDWEVLDQYIKHGNVYHR